MADPGGGGGFPSQLAQTFCQRAVSPSRCLNSVDGLAMASSGFSPC